MEDTSKTNSEADFCRNGDDSRNIDPAVAVFVSDFLQYKLSQCGFQWRSSLVPAREASGSNRSIASKVGVALRSLADEFSSHFKDQFVEMCDKLDINADTMKPTIEGVANELFSEGIKWARIVALFVFGSELAMHCKNRNWPDLINEIAYSLSSYISEKLLPWINDHGGWVSVKLHSFKI